MSEHTKYRVPEASMIAPAKGVHPGPYVHTDEPQSEATAYMAVPAEKYNVPSKPTTRAPVLPVSGDENIHFTVPLAVFRAYR